MVYQDRIERSFVQYSLFFFTFEVNIVV